MIYKKTEQLNLFTNELEEDRVRENGFSDYNDFIAKFERKKTTDECYTPDAVFKLVVEAAKRIFYFEDSQIVRPFFPNGNYEKFDYPENCVVVDNPPFSLCKKIVQFYNKHNIKYFIFTNGLTAFSLAPLCSLVFIGYDIVYDNGAKIKTAFATNLFEEPCYTVDIELSEKLHALGGARKMNRYIMPPTIRQAYEFIKAARNGAPVSIKIADTTYTRAYKQKEIFGGAIQLNNENDIKQFEGVDALRINYGKETIVLE